MKKVWATIWGKKLEIALGAILAMFLVIWQSKLPYMAALMIGYIAIVVALNENIVSRGLMKGWGDIGRDRLSFALVVVVGILLFIWSTDIVSTLFFIGFLLFVLYGWDSRVVAVLALISLVSCLFLLIAKQDVFAEQMAVFAYYFLVITVILQIIEYKRHPERFKEGE